MTWAHCWPSCSQSPWAWGQQTVAHHQTAQKGCSTPPNRPFSRDLWEGPQTHPRLSAHLTARKRGAERRRQPPWLGHKEGPPVCGSQKPRASQRVWPGSLLSVADLPGGAPIRPGISGNLSAINQVGPGTASEGETQLGGWAGWAPMPSFLTSSVPLPLPPWPVPAPVCHGVPSPPQPPSHAYTHCICSSTAGLLGKHPSHFRCGDRVAGLSSAHPSCCLK